MDKMEEMIREEIGKISSLQERVLFKEVMEQIFLSLYETNREMYEGLERRVMDEVSIEINRYRISSLVVDKQYIDRSHHFLSPMREEDLLERPCSLERIKKDWTVEGKSLVKRFFMEADYLQIEKFLEKKCLKGTIITNKREVSAEFLLEQNATYLEEISHLYEIFIHNGIPWQTLNTPYLYKFVDIYLPHMEAVFEVQEKIEEIKVNLEEFGKMAHEHYVPLWNIQKLTLNSVGFPVPCEDYENFEHTISIKDYGDRQVYLVDENSGMFHLRQPPGKLVITAKEAEAKKWKVLMIRKGESKKFERFDFPIMENVRNDSFPELFWKKQGVEVKTKAELSRFIRGFRLDEYVKFKGFEICDYLESRDETYSMNSFILDEIRRRDAAKSLLLHFQGGHKHEWLHRDMMSFLVSEVQLLYPEYRCMGKLDE